MTFRAKAVLMGALLVLGLSVAITSASANRLSVSNRAWRAMWSGLRISWSERTITCELTLEGSLHSGTFAKTRSALVGYVTDARAGACTLLTASVLRGNLPWHVQYESFTGTLPNINRVNLKIIGFEMSIREPAGIACLVRSTEASPLMRTLTRGPSGVISAEVSGTIASSFESCFGLPFTFQGSASGYGGPGAIPSPITMTLI